MFQCNCLFLGYAASQEIYIFIKTKSMQKYSDEGVERGIVFSLNLSLKGRSRATNYIQ
jgi:hypothetical protein